MVVNPFQPQLVRRTMDTLSPTLLRTTASMDNRPPKPLGDPYMNVFLLPPKLAGNAQ